MKHLVKLLMNDQLDQHNEKMSLDILQQAKEQTNAKIMSSHNEHDFRFPPIARVSKAYIKNENGVNSLYGEIEFFEIHDINKENIIKGKELALYEVESSKVMYDRSYQINGLVEDIEELQIFLSNEAPDFELKKSLEPISTLTIMLGTIASKSFIEGFFNKAGSDFWDKLKDIVSKNAKTNEKEKIYIFNTLIKRDNYKVDVIINFTNPTTYDIQNILYQHKEKIDYIINQYEENSISVARIVFNSYEESLEHEYSVFQDGTPFDIRDIDSYEKILDETLNKVISK